jgi:hypothetical protein
MRTPGRVLLRAIITCSPCAASAQDGLLAAAPPIGVVDARALAPGRWTYVTTANAGGQTQKIDRTLAIAAGSVAGTAAWLLVETQSAVSGSITDSLYVTRADASPIRHVLQRGADKLVAHDFSADSIHGSVMTPDGRSSPVATGYRAGPLVSGSMLEAMLRLLPLSVGWSASSQMLAAGPQGNLLVPIQLSVTGQDTVTVPAGTFPSWVLVLRAQNSEQRLWVAKRGRELVKLSTSPQPGVTVETVLVATTTAK